MHLQAHPLIQMCIPVFRFITNLDGAHYITKCLFAFNKFQNQVQRKSVTVTPLGMAIKCHFKQMAYTMSL